MIWSAISSLQGTRPLSGSQAAAEIDQNGSTVVVDASPDGVSWENLLDRTGGQAQ